MPLVRASLRLADADFLEGRVAEAVARYGALQQGSAAGAGRDWRAQAVRLTAASENARKLVADGYFLEARAALDAWEDEFPLSKVSGDFMIVEARLYARIGAYRRARRLLEAYCRGVEMTSYLAEAMRDALTCMMNDKAGDDALREFCAQMKKRFAFHPAGRDAEVMLQMLRRDQPARDPTPDRF